MSYWMDFEGKLELSPALNEYDGGGYVLAAWLRQRHYTLDPDEIMEKDPNWQDHIVAGTEIGEGGWNYVIGYDTSDINYHTPPYGISVIDYNRAPGNCPGLWSDLYIADGCLVPSAGNSYHVDEWIEFICDNILSVLGIRTDGEIEGIGYVEDEGHWVVSVDNNITNREEILDEDEWQIDVEQCSFKLGGDMHLWHELMPEFLVPGERYGWEQREDITIEYGDFSFLDVDYFQNWCLPILHNVIVYLVTDAPYSSECEIYLTAYYEDDELAPEDVE